MAYTDDPADRNAIAQTDERPMRSFGPVAAVFIAAGIGAVVLGIVTTLSEASKSFADALQWSDSVGPLSGKTIVTAVVFFIAWGILHAMWKDKDPAPGRIFLVSWILVAIGLLLTFPIFFQLFAPE
jgi:hypothetical protein